MENESNDIERHPWAPFMPAGARVLIMGTFPPGQHRWSMDFYYPNPTNDFWRIMGLLYFADKDALWLAGEKRFNLERIKALLTERGIAMSDTARMVRRLRGNASDKFLEILEPTDIRAMLGHMPECRHVVCTGEKAAAVAAEQLGVAVPKIGECATSGDGITLWRMPSSSRAYPMALPRKAEFYARMLRAAGGLP